MKYSPKIVWCQFLNEALPKLNEKRSFEYGQTARLWSVLKLVAFMSDRCWGKRYVCVSGGKKCSFFGKFSVFCFLKTSVLRFALLPYYRRVAKMLTLYWTLSQMTLHYRHYYLRATKYHAKAIEDIVIVLYFLLLLKFPM